jgi:LAO/AO transport system kinase
VKARLSVEQYENGIIAGDRIILAKAITLIESSRKEDAALATQLLERIMPRSGNSIRIGITGVPGVGKSSFIETFGEFVIGMGKKLAVLTVDPSSQVTKGSILGDKTRMERLSKNSMAFIRPSASGNTLGGVAHATREAMMVCEAAGFDVILIETVGVGQSETTVKSMVDFFLLLMLAGAGDELQGIKKGIIEMADALVITKADGDNVKRATEAQAEYQHALHVLAPQQSGWMPKVLTCSAHEQKGIEEIWKLIIRYTAQMQASGFLSDNRKQQTLHWFTSYFDELLKMDFHQNNTLSTQKSKLESEVVEQKLSVHAAAQKLLKAYHASIREK